jgi:hypothetical protein
MAIMAYPISANQCQSPLKIEKRLGHVILDINLGEILQQVSAFFWVFY